MEGEEELPAGCEERRWWRGGGCFAKSEGLRKASADRGLAVMERPLHSSSPSCHTPPPAIPTLPPPSSQGSPPGAEEDCAAE